MKSTNVAVIGGSFNPITFGHMQLGELVAKLPMIDRVLFVPNDTSVFGKNLESWEHRSSMVKIVVDYLNTIMTYGCDKKVWFEMCSIEHERKLDGYTISLAAALKEELPDFNFYFVIGQDIANNINKYKFFDKLIEELTFIVVPRARYVPNEYDWYLNGKHIIVPVDEPLIDVSSTDIRELRSAGILWPLMTKLPTGVLEYIAKNNLYVNK